MEVVNKILQLYPQNHYALFIKARNENNAEQKTKQFDEIFKKYPKYVRSAN